MAIGTLATRRTAPTAGTIGTRFPVSQTPRQTPYAPAAPGVIAAQPADTGGGVGAAAPSIGPYTDRVGARASPNLTAAQQAYRANRDAARRAYQERIAARRQARFEAQQTWRDAQAQRRAAYQETLARRRMGSPTPTQTGRQVEQVGPEYRLQSGFGAGDPGTGFGTAPAPAFPYAPGAYPSASPNIYTPANIRNLSPGAGQPADAAQRQRALLGNLGEVLGLDRLGQNAIQRQDIPLLEAGLNFQNIQLAERDRESGYNQYARARGAIGQDPNTVFGRDILRRQAGGEQNEDLALALQLARERATSGPASLEREGTVLKERSALGTQEAVRRLQEDYARRGIQGPEQFLEAATLEQQGSQALNAALAELEGRREEADRLNLQQFGDLGLARETGIRTATGQLLESADADEQRRLAIDDALARLFLDTERGEISLSGLVEAPGKKVGRQYI